jgi:hydroxyacylglutathione hydrolase
MGAERLSNPTFALAGGAPEAFRAQALGGLGRYPDYYAHMAGMNRRGPRVLGRLILPPALDPAAFAAAVDEGVPIVDARDRTTFAAGHLPGSMNIELDGTFAGYVGWLLPFGKPVLLVLPDDAPDALATATTELLRIGYDWVRGWLDGGIGAWTESGGAVSSYDTTTMQQLHDASEADPGGRVLLDVRQPNEWAADGVVPGAERIFVADLPARIAELPTGSAITVFCRSGSRASIAASLLDGAGMDVELVAHGGAAAWPEPLAHLGTE